MVDRPKQTLELEDVEPLKGRLLDLAADRLQRPGSRLAAIKHADAAGRALLEIESRASDWFKSSVEGGAPIGVIARFWMEL